MAIHLWDPFSALDRIDREFDEISRRARGAPRRFGPYMPAVDITRDGDDVLLTLELPGIDEQDLELEVNQGRLTISGTRHERRETEAGDIRELRYGEFRRDFVLPEGTTHEQIEATYDRGLLEVRVKDGARTDKRAHKIPIQRNQTAPRAVETQGDQQQEAT